MYLSIVVTWSLPTCLIIAVSSRCSSVWVTLKSNTETERTRSGNESRRLILFQGFLTDFPPPKPTPHEFKTHGSRSVSEVFLSETFICSYCKRTILILQVRKSEVWVGITLVVGNCWGNPLKFTIPFTENFMRCAAVVSMRCPARWTKENGFRLDLS